MALSLIYRVTQRYYTSECSYCLVNFAKYVFIVCILSFKFIIISHLVFDIILIRLQYLLSTRSTDLVAGVLRSD